MARYDSTTTTLAARDTPIGGRAQTSAALRRRLIIEVFGDEEYAEDLRLHRLCKLVAEAVERKAPPAACLSRNCAAQACSYYRHYLRHGPADMGHDAYHVAEADCLRMQRQSLDWEEVHFPPEAERCAAGRESCSCRNPYEAITSRLEARIRA